ncbi:outer membrane beta-barrel protein [Rhodopseudomonas sp. HC1]|uniref:outer membrane protein n=1 Tax=Rhodopseudomonas infernalis TaxID=2897386 RepID=UPI001EE7BD88|nr:outer membrane beta-barrel protein [Rhodopseudomonas infernalis]MCG6207018.1 outer membrane beta-barrel protein [Rhodopseudomonas infernalis]
MRGVWVAAAMIMVAHGAQAADLPEFGALRGAVVDTPGVVNWQGFYVGGQAGYGTSDMDFTNSTQGVAANLLTNTAVESVLGVSSWPVLGKASSHGQGWGGFVGYNAQWDDVVLGIEANYMHGTFGGSMSGSMGRQMASNGVTYGAIYGANAGIKVHDVGSARLRAGWAFGGFLPYAFGGVALGQADIVQSASIIGTDSGGTWMLSGGQVQNSHFIYGYSAGLGVDMMVYRGLFVRAEWEYQKFAAPINTAVSTVRGGVGYKF